MKERERGSVVRGWLLLSMLVSLQRQGKWKGGCRVQVFSHSVSAIFPTVFVIPVVPVVCNLCVFVFCSLPCVFCFVFP